MSVVVAIKDKNKIVIGCDSQVSYGHLKSKLDNELCCKIWDIENCKKGIMGVVGSLRDGQIIQCEEHLIDELKQFKNEVNYKYVVKILVNKIYELLFNNNRIKKDTHGNYQDYIGSSFIFAYKDMAYLIDRDLTVLPIEDYIVIGCGDEIAMGVLENNKGKSAEERILEAIKTCSEKSSGIDSNIVIKTT